MENFVMIPRQIKSDFIDAKLSFVEFLVLVWILLDTNPVSGHCDISYQELVEVFQPFKVSNDTIRHVISSIRRHKYIWFQDHKGRGGKFTIRPCNFQLTNGYIQTWENLSITTLTQQDKVLTNQPNHNLQHNQSTENHNFNEQKKQLIKGFSMDREVSKITTPYTDTNNDNDINTELSNIKVKSTETSNGGLEELRKQVEKLGLPKIPSKGVYEKL